MGNPSRRATQAEAVAWFKESTVKGGVSKPLAYVYQRIMGKKICEESCPKGKR